MPYRESHLVFLKCQAKPGVVVHTFSPSTWEGCLDSGQPRPGGAHACDPSTQEGEFTVRHVTEILSQSRQQTKPCRGEAKFHAIFLDWSQVTVYNLLGTWSRRN